MNDQLTHRRPWWRNQKFQALKRRIAVAPANDLQVAASEMSAALADLQGQLESGDGDDEWRGRANRARGRLAQRKHLIAAELQRRKATNVASAQEQREHVVRLARELIREGKLSAALAVVLDWTEREP